MAQRNAVPFLLRKFMSKVNRVERYNAKKESIRFETDLEKKFHKIISGMRYGERIDVEVDISSPEKKKEVVKAIEKSISYNCAEISHRVSTDKKTITLSAEVL